MKPEHIQRIAKIGTWPERLSGLKGPMAAMQVAHTRVGDLLDALATDLDRNAGNEDLSPGGRGRKATALGTKALEDLAGLRRVLAAGKDAASKAQKMLLDPTAKTDSEKLLSLLQRQEIRSHLLNMDRDTRDLAIMNAINTVDSDVLDALASAPRLLKLTEGDQSIAVSEALLEALNPVGYNGLAKLRDGTALLGQALSNAQAHLMKESGIDPDIETV